MQKLQVKMLNYKTVATGLKTKTNKQEWIVMARYDLEGEAGEGEPCDNGDPLFISSVVGEGDDLCLWGGIT